MARESREIWSKRVERWKDSGLTATEFATELGVSAGALKWWKWRLATTTPSKSTASATSRRRPSAITKPTVTSPLKFVEMTAPVVTDVPLEVVLPSALLIRVRAGFDDRTLGRLLDVLERRR